MIYLDSITEPSELIRHRASLMWVRQIKNLRGLLVFRVTPHGTEFDHRAKTKRIVTVDLVKGTADCFDRYTSEPCTANSDYVPGTGESKTPRLCSHVYAVLVQIAANQKRQKRESRAA
jgi:hypothetical protein